MSGTRESIYRWFRSRVPAPVRRALKALPGAGEMAERSRPRGSLWLPVRLAPGIELPMLLPEAFHWISYEGYEPEPVNWLTQHLRPGSACLDVGGHIGVYTLLMAELTGVGGSVHAFEPYAPNVEVLRQNVDRNGLAQRVTLVQAAVDSEDGGSVDLFAGDGTSEASLYEADSRPARWEVPRVSLDAYLRRVGVRQVHFIKMDVEGAEEQALRGGEGMLRESSPDILLEVHGYGGVGAVRFLEELGYAVALLSGDPTTSDALENRVQQVIAQKRVSEP